MTLADDGERLRVMVHAPRVGRGIFAALAGHPGLDVRMAAELYGGWEGGPDVFLGAGVPAGSLLDLSRLRWVQWVWAGVDGLLSEPGFVDALSAGRLRLSRAVGVFGRPVAEYVIAYCLALEQDVPRALALQKDRLWRKWRPGCLRGKRMGVAGLGSLGLEIARLAGLLGLEVSGLARTGSRGRPAIPGLASISGPESLVSFVRELDYLVLALPLTPATRHIITRDVLAAMKETATLVNVGRGALVEEAALVRALKSGRPGRAVLDVFEDEPLPPASELWDLPGVIITPHVAGLSQAADIVPLFLRNLERYRQGAPLEGEVKPDLGY